MTARRGLLSASGLALALAAGCGGGGGDRAAGAGGSSKPLSALPAPMRLRDIAVIDALLQREYELIAAYTAGIPLLDEPGRLAAEQFLGQHLGHAGELAGWIKQARGKPSKPLAAYELGAPRTAPQMLTALHGHESGMIAAYLAAMPTLSPGKLRANTASILANEAQHVAVLRSVLGLRPAPLALVTGGE